MNVERLNFPFKSIQPKNSLKTKEALFISIDPKINVNAMLNVKTLIVIFYYKICISCNFL